MFFLDAAHYMPFALAAYSTLMYIYINPCCAFCKLCHFRCTFKEDHTTSHGVIVDPSGNKQNIIADNMW